MSAPWRRWAWAGPLPGIAQPELLGNEGLLTTRLLIGLFGGLLFGAVGTGR